MNFDNLRTFLEVVRLGSFSEVAKKLAISQPAVSFQIQKLEHELSTRLIDRSHRDITLTAAGRRLLSFAESIGEEREKLQHDLEQMRDEFTGELLVTTSTIPGEFLLPRWLARFKSRHPAVKLRVDISDSITVINGVSNNSYEVGFCGIAPDAQGLTTFQFSDDRIVLIVFPSHPFARHDEISPDELTGEPLIFREETSGTQRSLESHLARAGLDPEKLTPNLILGTTQAVVAAVEGGAGIAFVSNLAIKKSLALGLVKEVAVSGLDFKRDFYCIYRQDNYVSRLLIEFINFIKLEASGGKNSPQD